MILYTSTLYLELGSCFIPVYFYLLTLRKIFFGAKKKAKLEARRLINSMHSHKHTYFMEYNKHTHRNMLECNMYFSPSL